ncbi:metalloreductase STEAP2 [Antechinus flavipes]|uniref:metalloreductase STEAP2 n=1 Tax=Antechinus flavipes TaxID=38775 RepID=UPI00223685E2|nr:metalloreductase STEAP2 [Antechinus flavipes]
MGHREGSRRADENRLVPNSGRGESEGANRGKPVRRETGRAEPSPTLRGQHAPWTAALSCSAQSSGPASALPRRTGGLTDGPAPPPSLRHAQPRPAPRPPCPWAAQPRRCVQERGPPSLPISASPCSPICPGPQCSASEPPPRPHAAIGRRKGKGPGPAATWLLAGGRRADTDSLARLGAEQGIPILSSAAQGTPGGRHPSASARTGCAVLPDRHCLYYFVGTAPFSGRSLAGPTSKSPGKYLSGIHKVQIIFTEFYVVFFLTKNQVYVCSNNIQARHQVIELARQLNFIPIDLGSLSSAREIENLPLRLFTLWRGPVVVAISLATFFFLYSFVRDVIHPYARNQQSDFYKIPIEIVNKTLPIVAITLLSLVYLAGLLAAAYQLYYGTKYRRFPPWLETWLQCRKQLGLLSFFFAAVHVAYSLCLPMRRSERYLFLNMAYQQVHANIENSWNEEEVWRIEMYISFGIMSLGLLSLLAVTSIPSVSNALNWREFSFIQSTLGYVALLISTFHVLIYGWKRAFEEEYYRFYTPPNFVLALVLPSIVILGKIILLFPCISRKLKRIKKGWEKSQFIEVASGIIPHLSPERVTVM